MATENQFREKIEEINTQKETITAIFSEGDGDPGLFDEMFNQYLNMIDWLENNNESLFTNEISENIVMDAMNETECGNKLRKAYMDKYQRGKTSFANFLREVNTQFREGSTEAPLPQFGLSPAQRSEGRAVQPVINRSSQSNNYQQSQVSNASNPQPPQKIGRAHV